MANIYESLRITEALSLAGDWALEVFPRIIAILVVSLIGMRLLSITVARTKKIMARQVEKNPHIDTAEGEKRVETLSGIIHSLLKVTLLAIVFMLILRAIGIDIGPLLAGAGVMGLAISFGARELVADFISGFFLLLENHVRAGDVAIVNGTGGLVERVGLRTIVLRDVSGVVHVFQNGKISSLSNMTKEWSAMVFNIGVAYKEDVDHVMKVMQEVGDELSNDPEWRDNIIDTIEINGLDDFADSALVIRARYRTKPIMQWSVGREYRRRLKKKFDELDIEIPFPHQTIYWGSEIDPLKISGNSGEEQVRTAD